ncbi:MAG TPA: NHL repeat-containing protein [Edaphobacter sp.]|nr:NHL repeat-containing protein [Edaphobacter sp.]
MVQSRPDPPSTPTPPANTYSGTTFTGKVFSGTTPLQRASIQIYAAGTTGNGSASTSLLTSTLTTDATGSFTVPASYPCPSATSQLYLIAHGGNLGGLTATNNPAIALSTILGPCNQVASSSPIVINEVTTAATAWGLAQFFATGGSLGASATNIHGFSNAFVTVANLVNLTTGVSPGAAFPSTGLSPAPKINTLANLLNTCIAATTSCASLFTLATPNAATVPANTFDAALNIVHNPALNVANLYTQSTTSTAFTPALDTAPADWTLFIHYTGGGMFDPGALGVDSSGNIWVSSYTNPTGTIGTASKFSSTGQPLLPTGVSTTGLTNSYGLAIDASDNVWIPYEKSPYAINKGLGAVAAYNSTGQPISGTGFATGGLNFPIAAALDPNGTAWIVNYGNASLTTLSSAGQSLSPVAGYTAASFAFPTTVAIDANHNAWIGNQNDDAITRISPDGTQSLRVSCCNGPNGLAIDQRGNIWAANYFGDSVSQISSTGTVISSNYTGGGILHPQGIAVDGSGNIWVTNFRSPSLTELAGSASSNPGQPLSPTTGWAPDSDMLEAFAIAIDASGNLWLTNFGDDTLTEFVGLASPVKTPLLGPPQAP